MLPAFLITLREVIEASLIVATILGILVRLKQTKSIRTVWVATGVAAAVSIFLLALGSMFGVRVQELYTGRTEELIEGILMITSAVFITWAVFFLHNYFALYKTKLLMKIKNTVEKQEQKGIFILVFTAVFREGFEIVLFLSTIFFSSNPQSIFTGFLGGASAGLLISWGLFAATLRMPVFYAFRVTSFLLILFAGGLLVHGIHEFAEVGLLPEIGKSTLAIMPEKKTFAGEMLQAVFGLTKTMDFVQVATYSVYVLFMTWWVFLRNRLRVHEAH